MTREELIQALEAATGPSRELDAEITAFIGLAPLHDKEWMLVPSNMEAGQQQVVPVPWFTDSIDAALTLVPEDYLSVSFTLTRPFTGIPICIAALKARGENAGT